jgi:hypothetical protein
MRKMGSVPVFLLLLVFAAPAFAQAGRIHPDPAKPRPGFKPHQLPFETPQDGVARDEFRSAPFFAVILKTVERCSVKEKERAEIQAQFPAQKVFAPLTSCDEDPEDTIFYTNVNPKVGFIAVYAGDTEEQAQQFLAVVKQSGRFPGANLRRMQAVLGYP